MEIFYSDDIQGPILSLPAEEAAHCVRVLRHRPGDHIDVIDGRGTLYHCTLLDPASDLADTPSGAGIDLPVGGGSKNGRKCSTPQGLGVGGASKTAKNAAAPFRSSSYRNSATVARRGHSASTTVARIDSSEPGWHSHPYRLTLAVCPTKNPDRYEWMAEKATEVGFDVLVPVIGDRSERKVLGKEERLQKILLSAAKQSLKGAVPQLAAPVSVRDFIASLAPGGGPDAVAPSGPTSTPDTAAAAPTPGTAAASAAVSSLDCQNRPKTLEAQASEPGLPSKSAENASRPASSLRLIAYCSDEVQPRASIMALLREYWQGWCQKSPKTLPTPGSEAGLVAKSAENATNLPEAPGTTPEIIVLIGPEGDFSPEEVRAAIAAGFIPVSLGASRLRTETAAVTAAEAVYLSLL